MDISQFIKRVDQFILNPLIILFFTVALLVFMWGLVEFLLHPDEGADREKGKRNILYGILGMLVMVAAFGIIRIILDTFGLPATYGPISF